MTTITQDRVRELLTYNPDTGEFTWRVARPRVQPGDVAGYISTDGARRLNLDGQPYTAARVAWLYVYGVLPSVDVTHKNKKPGDDRITNLELYRPQATELTAERLRELFHYDAETGEFRRKIASKKLAENAVVTGGKDRYGMINIAGARYRLHTLAWLYVYGHWPTGHIDHINGNKRDHRISNLRTVTIGQNNCNRGPSVTNTSGFKGVSYCKVTKSWVAEAWLRGVRKRVGGFASAEDAYEAYKAAAMEMHGEYAWNKIQAESKKETRT